VHWWQTKKMYICKKKDMILFDKYGHITPYEIREIDLSHENIQ